MSKIGRNDACHCGSGKKYKKCCMRKDEEKQLREQEERKYEQDVLNGRIDPFAGDEDWLADPAQGSEEGMADNWEEEDGHSAQVPFVDPLPVDPPSIEGGKSISDGDEAIIDAWWNSYRDLSNPDQLRDHIEKFMNAHPALVGDLGLEEEPLFRLQDMYERQGRPEEYIAILSRLRSEFYHAYVKGFSYFDDNIISWLIVTGQKEKVADYLDGFRENPTDNPDNLFELVHFLMGCNCQEILADFLPEIVNEVCTSPLILGSDEILSPMITILMAPFLDRGLEEFNADALSKKIQTLASVLNPIWLEPQFLKVYFHGIFDRHEHWDLNGCSTRSQALVRYENIIRNFMGWLGTHTKMDWCAAEYHSQLVFDYLAVTLPEKKKPREPFPFSEKEMERILLDLSKKMLWLDSSRFFGMLNGLYWFASFLEETLSLAAEQARVQREACIRLFNKAYPVQEKQDLKARIWKRFPRDE